MRDLRYMSGERFQRVGRRRVAWPAQCQDGNIMSRRESMDKLSGNPHAATVRVLPGRERKQEEQTEPLWIGRMLDRS